MTHDHFREATRLERTNDEQLPAVVADRCPSWESTARAILEFGEEGLVEGVVSEQAVAVLLLAREVRRLRELGRGQGQS